MAAVTMKYAAAIAKKEETKIEERKVFNSYATERERRGPLPTVD